MVLLLSNLTILTKDYDIYVVSDNLICYMVISFVVVSTITHHKQNIGSL